MVLVCLVLCCNAACIPLHWLALASLYLLRLAVDWLAVSCMFSGEARQKLTGFYYARQPLNEPFFTSDSIAALHIRYSK